MRYQLTWVLAIASLAACTAQVSQSEETGTTSEAVTSASTIAASLSVTKTSSSYYSAVLTVTNNSSTTASNWQVALNMNQSTVFQALQYGGVTGITNGSVYFNQGHAIFTPYNGQTLAAHSNVQVKFVGAITGTNYTPTIVSVDGVAGSSVTMWNDGIDHTARAAATAALNIIVDFEATRTTMNQYDAILLDSHIYTVSSDGSQIIFDPAYPQYSLMPATAISDLAVAQMDPSVASYLVSGLLSCFGDDGGSNIYAFRSAALKGWSYTTTPQNVTINAAGWTPSGTDNVYRVGSFANGQEQITLKLTVNANSEDHYFGMVYVLPYDIYEGSGGMWNKFHNANAFPCSPFNGPGGPANPYLIISVNGASVGARQQISNNDCPAINNCTATAVIDPVAYASSGQFYNSSGNLVGPSSNPFSLDPKTLTAYNPDHKGQWAQDPAGNWGQFSVQVFSNGRYWYQWRECAGGVFNANGC